MRRVAARYLRGLVLAGVTMASVLIVPGVAPAVEVGEPAPDFALPSTTGETISLNQFRGKHMVLLEFYGADFFPA
jgi:hypothetical protein